MGIRVGGAPMNIANGIREFAVASPRAVAIVDGDATLTYAALDERSSRLGNALLSSGLGEGAHVAVLSGNRLEYPEIATGIAKAGMVMIPLNPRSAAPEIAFILDHSNATALILDNALAGAAALNSDFAFCSPSFSRMAAAILSPPACSAACIFSVDPKLAMTPCCNCSHTRGAPNK